MEHTILQYDSGCLTAKLERTQKTLVENVSFSIKRGESLVLIGETGSGKTMIAQSIMGLLPENVDMDGGAVFFLERPLPSRAAVRKLLGVDMVYIPQNGLEFLDPSKTIRRQIYDSLKKRKTPAKKLEESAVHVLERVGFGEVKKVLDSYPFQLSGGMAQRVVIAIAACSRAELVIADEPTNGLDDEAKSEFKTLLEALFPEAAKLIITHDIAVAEMFDETLVLCRGKMMEKGPSDVVLRSPRHPYTQALLAAAVKNGMRESPYLRKDSGFCPYFRRCPMAQDRCRQEMRPYREGNVEWWCNQVP